MNEILDINPYSVNIIDIFLQKYDGRDKISLLSQIVEMNFYMSLVDIMKSVFLIDDRIGLFDNYPLTGEERITVVLNQGRNFSDQTITEFKLEFYITEIKDIKINQNNRGMIYTIYAASEEYTENAKRIVSRCIYDSGPKAANTIFQDFLVTPIRERNSSLTEPARSLVQPKNFEIEDGPRARKYVISQQYPLDAIRWLTKHSVSPIEDNFTYLFYEDFNGFHFKTMEKLIKDGKLNYGDLYRDRFIYTSNYELVREENNLNRNLQYRVINNITYNRRNSTLEKVASGYIANEYVDINPLLKTFKVTKTQKDITPTENTLERFPLNTDKFITDIQDLYTKDEMTPKIKYAINIHELGDEPEYEKKFGKTIQHMTGLNQIDKFISVPLDLTLTVGQVIWLDFGSTHGFNQIETEKYVSGCYLIFETKHVILGTGNGSTVLRVFRDSYLNKIEENMKYSQIGQVTETTVTNPTTGEITR